MAIDRALNYDTDDSVKTDENFNKLQELMEKFNANPEDPEMKAQFFGSLKDQYGKEENEPNPLDQFYMQRRYNFEAHKGQHSKSPSRAPSPKGAMFKFEPKYRLKRAGMGGEKAKTGRRGKKDTKNRMKKSRGKEKAKMAAAGGKK